MYPEVVDRLKSALDDMRARCGDSNMKVKGAKKGLMVIYIIR